MPAAAPKDRVRGEWQTPVNRWQAGANSIHNDAVARRIGMRGGTIPGTVHLSWFRPILDDLYGDAWRRAGSISMYYTFATMDGEEVRAVVERPQDQAADVQLEAFVETPDGRVVCKGTVACGAPSRPGYVRGLTLENAPRSELRILADMTPGMPTPERDAYVIEKGGESGLVVDPQEMYRALAASPKGIDLKGAVGFFGATEIVLHAGPIRLNTPYRKMGVVASVGASPKTEFAWFDSWLHDPAGGLVAEMRHMTRWMKASSPAWAS